MYKEQRASTAGSKRICVQGEDVAAKVSLICGIGVHECGELAFNLSIEVPKDYEGKIPVDLLRRLVVIGITPSYIDSGVTIPASAKSWGELIDILRINTSQPTEV